MDFDWKSIVGTVAPLVGTAIGGPFGGMAAKFITDALGLPEDAPQDQISEALKTASPEVLLKLKESEHAFKVQMKELGIKKRELEYKDTGDARNREIMLKDFTPKLLAFCVTVGFFGILFALMYGAVPAGEKQVLDIMLGALATAWISIIGYYFGSSAGSSSKNDMIYNSEPMDG